MTTRMRGETAGFTLIESLIALAILAITAVSFLRATEANIDRVSKLETRAAASWVAQNRLAEMALRMTTTQGPVTMLGRDFTVTVVPSATTDPGLIQVDVSAEPANGGTGAKLTGFIVQPGAGGS